MGKRDKTIDYWLLSITTILIVFGIVFLASASSYSSERDFGDPFYLIKHQLINLGIGIIIFFFCLKINLLFFKKWFFYIFLINLLFTLLVFVPGIGISSGNSTRWLSIGGISIQPSEFLKLSFILYLATWLSNQKKNKEFVFKKNKNVTLFIFLLIISLIIGIFYLQSDLSTSLLIIATGGLMYFASKHPFWHNIVIFSYIILGGWIFSKISPYRMSRILMFLNPGTDPLGMGYQIEQAKIAVGSGGITGVGLGMSQQRFGLLPQPISDSIFAILAEETGFVGATILVIFFLLFAWRGFKIAKEGSNDFFRLISVGITSWIFIQSLLNIGAIIGLMPLTGIPLPFISYGGSALISELAGVGILLNISKNQK